MVENKKINEIIRAVFATSVTEGGNKMKWVDVAAKIEEKTKKAVSPAALSDRLKNERMTVNSAIEMLNAMGYDLVAVPREKNRESYIVEPGGERERKRGEKE